MTILEILKKEGYDTVKASFYDKYIANWRDWYRGNVRSFHHYTVYNGNKTKDCHMHTLQMGKKVCEDWANLLMNERVKITVDGITEQDFIDKVFADNNFYVRMNEMQEAKMALGTVAYVPTAMGVELSLDGSMNSGESIRLNYVTAESIYPLRWDNGKIKECAFAKGFASKSRDYVYLQMHVVGDNGKYVIKNRFFDITNGNTIELQQPPNGYENIPAEVNTNSAERQFIIDRPNVANNLIKDAPIGISIFGNSIDVLKGIDLVYDSYDNEFILGKKRIMVSAEATNSETGKPVFDDSELVYYQLPTGIQDEQFIKEIDMTLRCEQHQQALQDRLNILSSKCGFGESYYKFEKGTIQTATQVVSENSTLFRTIRKHEIILEDVIKELVRVILTIGRDILKQSLNPDAEVAIDFDDSIIEDTNAEKQQFLQEIRDGIRQKWEYRIRFFGETEDEAKKNIDAMQSNDKLMGFGDD